jgi:GNAT superfamily N-acetyltransferase
MPDSDFTLSNLIVRQVTTKDLRHTIQKTAITCIIAIVIIIAISFFGISYITDGYFILIVFTPILLLLFVAVFYNLGRLMHFFPMQPKGITSWVAIYRGKFIGWADVNKQIDYSILENVSVHHKYRRRKVGSLLIQTLRQDSIEPLYVQSAPQAVKFYQSLGFIHIDRKELPSFMKKYGNHLVLKNMVLK